MQSILFRIATRCYGCARNRCDRAYGTFGIGGAMVGGGLGTLVSVRWVDMASVLAHRDGYVCGPVLLPLKPTKGKNSNYRSSEHGRNIAKSSHVRPPALAGGLY